MSSHRHPLLTAVAFGLACFVTHAAEDVEAPAAAEISVLTPAVEGRFFVVSGVDPSIFFIPVSFARMADSSRSTALRNLATRERYDPARPLADRLVDALAEASYRPVLEPLKRKPAGAVQSLAWSDLPENPKGEVMLDVTVRWLCLCSELAYGKFYPALALGWRVLNTREVVLPTRELVYKHWPPEPEKKETTTRRTTRRKLVPQTEPKPEPVTKPTYPEPVISESCGFDSVKDAEQNPAVLWGCFAEAYETAVGRLVIDLERVHPPRAALTASGDTPSGISTQ